MAKAPTTAAKPVALPECLQKIADTLPESLEGRGAVGYYVDEDGLGAPVATKEEEELFTSICLSNGLVAEFCTLPNMQRYLSVTRVVPEVE